MRSVSHPRASSPRPERSFTPSNVVASRWATALVAIEGALLVVLGVFLVVRGFGADAHNRAGAEIGGVLAVLGGAALGVLARGLLAQRRWALVPAIVAQVLALPVAVGLLQAREYAYGVPLLNAAVFSLVLLLMASSAPTKKEPKRPAR